MPKGPAQGDGAFPRAGSPRSGHGGPCGRRGLSCGDRWQVRRSRPAHRNVCGSQQLPFSSRGTFFLPASPPTPALTATAPFHNPATFMLDEGATSTHAAGRAGRTRRGTRAAWGRGGSGADLRAHPRLCSENPEHELLLLKHRNDFRVSSKIHVPPPRTQRPDSGICADVELGLHRGKVATPSDRVCACPSAHTGPHLYRLPLTDLRVTTANDKDTVLKTLVKTTAKLKDCTCTKC